MEFNARFGDPETQVQLPLLKSDLVDIMLAVIDGKLAKTKVEWNDGACVGVVMASGGYPGSYKQGYPITGLDKVAKDILIFHAGTKAAGGKVCTAGGRVLTVVATGKTIAETREKVYLNLPRISFDNCHYRKDIAAEEG
jgi:phosphoribosylamine--glycine ligase